MSKFKGVKTNNAKIDAKVNLRKMIDCSSLSVLELFCGNGEMFNSVWSTANHYDGVDIEPQNDSRITHVSDCADFLKKADISCFDVFDIDAYGSPYECIFIIMNKLKQSKKTGDIHFFVTDGLQIDLRMGNIENFFKLLLCLADKKLKNAYLLHDTFIKIAIKNIALNLNANIVKSLIAKGKTGSGMRYYYFHLSIVNPSD